jgi:hypothetical protein
MEERRVLQKLRTRTLRARRITVLQLTPRPSNWNCLLRSRLSNKYRKSLGLEATRVAATRLRRRRVRRRRQRHPVILRRLGR